MATLREKLIIDLEKINGLKDRPSLVSGASVLFYKNREFAHFHNYNELALRLTKNIIAIEGLYHPKRTAGSHWIELQFKKVGDLESIVKND